MAYAIRSFPRAAEVPVVPTLIAAAGCAALPVLGVAAHRAWTQRAVARRLRLEGPDGIVEAGHVPLGGIAQWVGLRGASRANPCLLVIHGGPGAPYSVLADRLRPWEARFTVVQWDQRGAGRTFGRHPDRVPTGFAELAHDGVELARGLRARLGVPIVLLGSSAGSITALHMARSHPALFSALVLADLNVGPDPLLRGVRRGVAALRARGDLRAADTVLALAARRAGLDEAAFGTLNRLLLRAARGAPDMIGDLFMPGLYGAPDLAWRDLLHFAQGQRASTRALLRELLDHDARRLAPSLALPVLVVQGAVDHLTDRKSVV
jgi:pimeloyl-ACP methyl ester carboxylesterase